MLFPSGFRLVVVLAAGGMLLSGCHSCGPAGTSGRTINPDSPAVSLNSDSPGDSKPSRDSLDGDAAFENDLIDAHAHYASALIHELNGETDEALSEYYEAAIRDLGNESLILEVSRRFLQAKQTEKALDLVTRATARPKASGNLFARLGFIYFQLGKQDQAIIANRTAIKREPRSLVGYQNLFLIYLQSKKPQEALSVVDEAAKVPRTTPEFLIGVGELYGNFGLQNAAQRQTAFARGIAVLQRVATVRSEISDPRLRLRLADGFSILGKDETAAEIYQEWLKEMPDDPFVSEGVRAKLADIYLRGRDHKRATEQLEGIIRDNPTDAQAYYFLGSIAYADTNYTRAVEYFSKVLLLNPDFEQAYYDLAGAQISAGKTGDALQLLEKARQKYPQMFPPEYLTAVAYTQQKDFTNAIKHFTAAEIIAEATDQRQLKDSFYFEVGAAFDRSGDYAQAEKYFEKCLVLSPNLSEAQNYLGYMLVERGEKLDRARELIARALKAEPKNAAYLDSMGWVLFKLNQPKEALDYLLEAVKNSEEEDATLYDHLGEIFSALNQPDKAREAWRKSLSIEPNDAIRRKLEPPPGKPDRSQ